jgi:PEP-CTERM motif
MKLKFNSVALALAALASVSAHAAITNSNTNNGNSSVLFVAQDAAGTVSFTLDLGVNMGDFLQAGSGAISTQTANGSLASDGVTPFKATWSFGGNSRAVNGAPVAGDYAWSTEFASFVTAAAGNYTWGIVAADNVTGALSGTNSIFNRNVLHTGTPTQGNINALTGAANLSNATANFQNFVSGTSGGTHGTNAEGASSATAGAGYLNTVMKGTFGGQFQWNYLSAIGATTNLFLSQQASNPVVYQIGSSYGNDTLLDATAAATFKFDGTTLSYDVPAVPEPGTYAMLLAGLVAVGFMARRRSRS